MRQTVSLSADKSQLDLGMVDLKASPLGKMKGKVLPAWSIADARGVNRQAKLGDYKGKWLYLEFWHWG
jgi:hypothetical protein